MQTEGFIDMEHLRPGSILGRYQVERVINRGGTAVVYAARSLDGSDRPVALKVIALAKGDGSVMPMDKLRREASE